MGGVGLLAAGDVVDGEYCTELAAVVSSRVDHGAPPEPVDPDVIAKPGCPAIVAPRHP